MPAAKEGAFAPAGREAGFEDDAGPGAAAPPVALAPFAEVRLLTFESSAEVALSLERSCLLGRDVLCCAAAAAKDAEEVDVVRVSEAPALLVFALLAELLAMGVETFVFKSMMSFP